MRLGVIADIHGNEVALRAVLEDAARCRVVRDLHRRRHPNAVFVGSVLDGRA